MSVTLCKAQCYGGFSVILVFKGHNLFGQHLTKRIEYQSLKMASMPESDGKDLLCNIFCSLALHLSSQGCHRLTTVANLRKPF